MTCFFKEVNYFMETLHKVDPTLSEFEEELVHENFKVYVLFIRDGLYHNLSGVSDTVEIQLKMKKARNDLMQMCYDYLCRHYQAKPHILHTLMNMHNLQSNERQDISVNKNTNVVPEDEEGAEEELSQDNGDAVITKELADDQELEYDEVRRRPTSGEDAIHTQGQWSTRLSSWCSFSNLHRYRYS